ncbi:MAG: B12-binding domain-containing radical SAM protein [Armatimonadetes bacterium CG07_land_8_20_14_0_80_40_9]|nr:MAG: B12-binding domain-containing radical SAM protein [Armatimonadetes bacterium CG07_land_8_20_14_0_80_40_9]
MKVLLIHPPINERTLGTADFDLHEPLSLEYISSGVNKFCDVKLLDMRLENRLEESLKEFGPNIVGMTAYTVDVNTVKRILKKVKEFNEKILTVVGGHHATVKPEDFFDKDIDLIVIGEGVFTFKEIVEKFETGKDFREIKGIAIREGEKLYKTTPRAYTKLDDLPLPQRSLTSHIRHNYFHLWMKPFASMRTSLGCTFRCNFCAPWRITEGKYLTRDQNLVLKELLTIKEENVFFADDDSLWDKDRMIKLGELIKEAGIKKKYFLFARADEVANYPELVEKWKEIGLSQVFVGFESYRDEDLKFFKKGCSISVNEEAIRILKENDISIYAQFIIRPDYDKKNFMELRDYVRRLKLVNPTFTVLTPFPGTTLYETTNSQIITHDYDIYDMMHTVLPTKLSLIEFYSEYANLYKRAVPFGEGILDLFKYYPIKEIIPTLRNYVKFIRALRDAYKDY